MNQNNLNTLSTRYPAALRQYEKAGARFAQADAEDCLTAARKALEGVIRGICDKCGLDTAASAGGGMLFSMIESLRASGFFTDSESELLHVTRSRCNKGAHEDKDGPPTLEDARLALELLDRALELLMEKEDDMLFARQMEANNLPLIDSDYYDPKRRCRGQWSHCYAHEELSVLTEYNALKRKAEAGDISAMLDLAAGFMSVPAVRGDHQLVGMPKIRVKGKEYGYDDAYDTRYYYWILRACDQAVANAAEGKSYPRKYMANAFVEALKFGLCTRSKSLSLYVTDITLDYRTAEPLAVYGNQYALVEHLYGENIQSAERYPNAFLWAAELLRMIRDAGTADIISPLHRENTEQSVRYLAYCYACLHTYCDDLTAVNDVFGIRDCVLDEMIILNEEDLGKTVDLNLLQQRTPAHLWGAGYYELVKPVCDEISAFDRRWKKYPGLLKFLARGAAVTGKIGQLAGKSPFLYRGILCAALIPLVAALYIVMTVTTQPVGGLLYLLGMVAMVACVAVHSMAAAFAEQVNVPEEGYSGAYHRICQLVSTAVLVIICGMLLLGIGQCTVVRAIVRVAALIACVALNPTLQGIYRMLRGKKAKR